MVLRLYQTLEDRDNPEEIENNGPYRCVRTDAWLGEGYYFWDYHISLGHWWGRMAYGQDRYIICQAGALMDDFCWDLHNIGQHREEFEQVCDLMVKEGGFKADRLLVPHIIIHLRRTKALKYKSIRALGISSRESTYFDPLYNAKIKFKRSEDIFLDLRPAVQVCLFEKRALSLSNYKVVYPSYYSEVEYT